MRTPDLVGKVSDVWNGPYEIIGKVTPVTYELAVPNRRSKRLIAHINRLKKWHGPEAIVLRVLVADEEEEEATTITQDIHGMSKELSDTQKKELRELIEESKD